MNDCFPRVYKYGNLYLLEKKKGSKAIKISLEEYKRLIFKKGYWFMYDGEWCIFTKRGE